MPIYEYECRACGHRFDKLHRTGTATVIPRQASCPQCGKDTAERRLSAFGIGSAGTEPGGEAPPFCGRCGENRPPCSGPFAAD